MEDELMAPANLRACYHLKGEMLDKPSAFPTRLWAESAPLAVPELLLGRRWKEASKGRGGKLRNESGNAFHKQQDSWNGSRGPDFKFFSGAAQECCELERAEEICSCPQQFPTCSVSATGCQNVRVGGGSVSGDAGWVLVANSHRHK